MNPTACKLTIPDSDAIPILISIPHCGIDFPVTVIDQYHDKKMLQKPDDTDWFVDDLHDFAPSLGITVISANYSRWLIDLNRPPDGMPLYQDGRIITGLCPATDFNGTPLYSDKHWPDKNEMQHRIKFYYNPYHQMLKENISRLKNKFGHMLLWDAHSIRRKVESIQANPFPDVTLGDNDGKSADSELINVVWNKLTASGWDATHNSPFKGGYITRHYGDPANGIHALQLEMSKDLYMNEEQTKKDAEKKVEVASVLKSLFKDLIHQLA